MPLADCFTGKLHIAVYSINIHILTENRLLKITGKSAEFRKTYDRVGSDVQVLPIIILTELPECL